VRRSALAEADAAALVDALQLLADAVRCNPRAAVQRAVSRHMRATCDMRRSPMQHEPRCVQRVERATCNSHATVVLSDFPVFSPTPSRGLS
jgi:hypothetical protein